MEISELQIRLIQAEDLDEIARIHIASFQDRALSQLGQTAVKRYYTWLLEGYPQNYPFCVCKPSGEIAAFCFAGSYSGSFSGFIYRNKGYLIGRILLHPWLIFNPIVREQSLSGIKALWKMLKFQAKQGKDHPNAETLKQAATRSKTFGVLAIAVDPRFQRQGIGKFAMQAVETYALEHGYEVLLLSVHPENQPAVSLYLRSGWEKLETGGKWDGKMAKRLVP